MFSYVKSLIALGLAGVVVLGLWLWFQHQSEAAAVLREEKRVLGLQMAEARAYPPAIAHLEARLRILKEELTQMAGRFAEKDNAGPQLVTAVVKAAGGAGMEMIRTTENVSQDKVLQSRLSRSPDVAVISYEFGLKGSYSSLVLLLQNMASWKLAHKIESLEISSPDEPAAQGQVETALVVSVFSSDRLNARKLPDVNP